MANDNEYMRVYMLNRYHARRAEAIELLGGKCAQCDVTEGLEFDHIDRTQKAGNIGKLWSYSETRWREEIAKCQLLCYEHHIDKSFEAGDFKGPRAEHGSFAMYRHKKCRCNLCKAANAKMSREYKARRKLRP
jgi:hypothetical protein